MNRREKAGFWPGKAGVARRHVRKNRPTMTETYRQQLERKRQQENSWLAIAREVAWALRTWIAAGATILAWRFFRLGRIRLAHLAFRISNANIPVSWRDQFGDWDEWSAYAREVIEAERLARPSWGALARMGFELLRLKAANRLFRLGRLIWDMGLGLRAARLIFGLADRLIPAKAREEIEREREAS